MKISFYMNLRKAILSVNKLSYWFLLRNIILCSNIHSHNINWGESKQSNSGTEIMSQVPVQLGLEECFCPACIWIQGSSTVYHVSLTLKGLLWKGMVWGDPMYLLQLENTGLITKVHLTTEYTLFLNWNEILVRYSWSSLSKGPRKFRKKSH